MAIQVKTQKCMMWLKVLKTYIKITKYGKNEEIRIFAGYINIINNVVKQTIYCDNMAFPMLPSVSTSKEILLLLLELF